MKRLLQIKQKPKQSITDFAYQLQSYFRQFASSFDNEAEKSNIMEIYLINAFCEGLRNIEIRRHLLAIKTERTFQNILNYAFFQHQIFQHSLLICVNQVQDEESV